MENTENESNKDEFAMDEVESRTVRSLTIASKTYPNKMGSRAAAVGRYGHIDFSTKHWPNQGKYLKTFVINPAWKFDHWLVLDTKLVVHNIACNVDIHVPLTKALQAVHDKNLGHVLKTFNGCFNIRMVRGTKSSPSAHAYGLALDLNARENPLGATHGGFYNEPEFVKCFTDQGFDWGGNFHSRKDPMHFSYCWE